MLPEVERHIRPLLNYKRPTGDLLILETRDEREFMERNWGSGGVMDGSAPNVIFKGTPIEEVSGDPEQLDQIEVYLSRYFQKTT